MNLNNALSELVNYFNHINYKFYNDELPEVMLTIQGGKGNKNRLGWFTTSKVWHDPDSGESRYEICVTAENLKRSPEDIFETILHETAHLYGQVNEIRTTAGIHHNKKFKQICEKHGLDVKYSNDIGWAFTSLNDLGKSAFSELEVDANAFKFARLGEEEKEKKEPAVRLKYACGCRTKVSRKEPIDWHCNTCDEDFQLQDEEEGDD